MNCITKTLVVALILFGVEITCMNFAEAASPKTKNILVHSMKGKVSRKPVTGLSTGAQIVRPKIIGTGKSAPRNKVAANTFQNMSSGNSNIGLISKNQKQLLGHSKTGKNQPSTRGKMKGMQRERGTSGTSHSSKDLKYGLKEGLKYGLKYGEKK